MNRPATYTIRFEQVTRTAVRKGKCTICGKSGRRQTTIMHTVNPFNRNKITGEPKTYDEVRKSVWDEAMAWEAEPFAHPRCEREAREAGEQR